jgi:hypothetical protein
VEEQTMLKLTFLSVAERYPKDGEEIIWLRSRGGLVDYFEPVSCTVEIQWHDGNGMFCSEPAEGWDQILTFDGNVVDSTDLYITQESWEQALEKAYDPS